MSDASSRTAPETFARRLDYYPPARWPRAVLHGVDKLPPTGALLVGNHGPLALETAPFVRSVLRETGRIVRSLADSIFFRSAVGRFMMDVTGSVEASRERAKTLLEEKQLVLVYPGGTRETQRSPREKYRLSWEGRRGFARTALECGVPVIPVACIGADDLFLQLVDHHHMLRTPAGRVAEAVLGKDYVAPLFLPRLRMTTLHFYIGEPVVLKRERASAWELEEAAFVLQQRAQESLEALMRHGISQSRARGFS